VVNAPEAKASSAAADAAADDRVAVADTNARLNSTRHESVAALVALGVAGASVFLAMPVVVAALSMSGLTDGQVGRFSSIQLFCMSIGCALSLWLGRRFDARSLAILALTTLLLSDVASALLESYSAFLFIRALAGVAAGVAISTTTAALARTRTPDRNFGWFLLCQITFQILATWLLPRLVAHSGIGGVFATFAVLDCAVLILLARHIPKLSLAGDDAGRGHNSPQLWLYCSLVLLSILCFFVAVGSFWTFVGRIGEQNVGLQAAQAGFGLSMAAFGGLAGAFLPVLLGVRFGRALPIGLAAAALIAGLLLMTHAAEFVFFVMAATLFSFGWFLIYPYQLGVLAALDRDGRPAIASAAVTGAGLGIGPALVVALLPQHGLEASFVVAQTSVVASAVLVFAAIALSRSKGSTPSNRTRP
jgi:predicted MFS family arabinose efflux permease